MGKQRGRRAVNRVKKCEYAEMTRWGEIFFKVAFLLPFIYDSIKCPY